MKEEKNKQRNSLVSRQRKMKKEVRRKRGNKKIMIDKHLYLEESLDKKEERERERKKRKKKRKRDRENKRMKVLRFILYPKMQYKY